MDQHRTIQLNPESSLGEQLVNAPSPAWAHDRASALIVSSKEAIEGWALSKTAALQCFQIHHAVSMISDGVPLHSRRWVDRSAFATNPRSRLHSLFLVISHVSFNATVLWMFQHVMQWKRTMNASPLFLSLHFCLQPLSLLWVKFICLFSNLIIQVFFSIVQNYHITRCQGPIEC
jgi:hypothetical protein